MTTADICILIAIFAYLAVMIVIGVVYSKRNKSSDDFYLGGRKLGPVVTAMSAEASDMSSWLLMGLPGLAMAGRFAEASWTAIGLAIGTYLNFLIVAKRLRRYSSRIDAFTVPDFFSKRFGDKKNILSLISALIIIVFFVPYTASGFSACGKLFNTLFGMDYVTAMIISAVVIVLYTTLGGFLAASTTDLIQSVVMTVALIVVLIFGINTAGGWDQVVMNISSLKGFVSFTMTHNPAETSAEPYGALTIASTLAWGLGYFGMPHILLRFMAIKDANKLKTSRRIAVIWVVISMTAAILIGIVGFGVVKGGAISELSDTERIIVAIAKLISSYGILPAIVAGIILAGILAATMSTADSQLLAASSSVSQNVIHDFFGIKLSEKKSMIAARISVIVISIIAVFMCLNEKSSVFSVVSFAWAGFGAAFGPVVLFALFWKRTNMWGALAGMITGGVMVFVWKYVVASIFADTILNIYELLPAFILACAAIVVVSLITAAPDKETTEIFDEVKAIKD
ncbi:MAG: sodium/proline symporter PutP [Acutalibacteraceae bacterium]|nr:sodium/proline symporter PutP [Acutalibacteraceae bacterium]